MKQIPQLYESNTNAAYASILGSLPDAIKCEVTEERNGDFYCEMTYPARGMNAKLISVGRIIMVPPNPYDNAQAFRIATIEKSLDGTMDITAYHISYDMANMVVMPFIVSNSVSACNALTGAAVPGADFLITTDIINQTAFEVKQPTLLKPLLVGMEGSLVDTYGGELKFDNWNVSLLQNRGQIRNVQIAYGKNLTGFIETDEIAKYDGVVPFAVFDNVTYYLAGSEYPTAPIVWANGTGPIYSYPRLLPLDMSDKYTEAAPTKAQLYADAQSYIRQHNTAATANMSTEYVDLAKLLGHNERVDLCDTVYITVTPFNIYNLTSKVISITYDVLTDENIKVEIGDKKITLADTLAQTIIAAEQKVPGKINLPNADVIRY